MKGKHTIHTLDMHTGGEPLRIVLDGFPEIKINDILAVRTHLKKHHDHLRKYIMWEPRGHSDMYGLLKVPAQRADSSFGVIFMHNEGYSTMCGHATIAIGRLAVDLNWVEASSPMTRFKMDAPCGQIEIETTIQDDAVKRVSFRNVPSFYIGSYTIDTEEWGKIEYDLAYGGAFYAYIKAEQIGAQCTDDYYSQFVDAGKKLKKKIIGTNRSIIHPFEESLSFLYGVIFIDEAADHGIHSRNVCVFADGQIDRCSTGSGISGRAAIHFAKGELGLNETISIQSILGTAMEVEVIESLTYGPYDAVVPQVSGMAYYTGKSEFLYEEDDPLKGGFLLG